MFWVGEEGEGSNSPPRGVPGSAGGPQWLTPPGELFPPAFWQVWLSGLRSLRQKDEVEGWVVSQAQIRIPGGGYLTIEKIFFLYFFQPLFLMYDKSMSTALTLWYSPVLIYMHFGWRDSKQQSWCVCGLTHLYQAQRIVAMEVQCGIKNMHIVKWDWTRCLYKELLCGMAEIKH